MTNYVIGRLLAVVPTLLVLLLFVVVLIRLLPGNAVDIILAEQANASKLDRQELEARIGLNKPLPQQYIEYATGVLRGDLGLSIWTRQPVTEIIRTKLPVTMELGILALTIGTIFGIVVGVVSAATQNSPIDYLLRSFSILGLSVPNFALALAVVVLPTLWWGWSPSVIYTPPSGGLRHHVTQFLAPALILGFGLSATLMRLTRTTMLEVLRQDYIRTARSKGLASRLVLFRHALRNALIPVVSLLGVQVAFVISGSVIMEQVYGFPGVGRQLILSLAMRDYPVIQGVTVVSGSFVIFANLLVDLSYGVLDPRIKVG
ncbi:MAG: ABC transporter permease [Dehalococcoidia bacterium]